MGHGATLAVAVLLVAGSIVGLRDLGQASHSILSENYRSIAATDTMVRAISLQLRLLAQIGSRGAPEGAGERIREAEVTFLQGLARARDNITIEGELSIVDAIQERYTRFLATATETAEDRDAAAERAAEEVLASCRDLRVINERTMYAASEAAAGAARRAVWAMAAAGAILVCLGTVVALELSRRAVLPLRRLQEATNRVAGGDYTPRVPVTTRDEIGVVTREFNDMVSQLALYDERNLRRLVAEQRKSTAILESLDDGILVLEPTNIVAAINPAAARVFDTSRAAVVGRHLLELEGGKALLEALTPAADARGDEGRPVVTLGKPARERHCMVSVTTIEASADEGPPRVVLLRDVTELKELDRLKSEFVSTASHELRGPLTSVAMSVSLLRESTAGKLGPREVSLLRAAEEELQRLRELVSDLLDLSRLESGRVDLSLVTVSPVAIIERAVELLREQAAQARLRLETRLPDSLPDVKVDAARITWVLTNLLGNGVRYTPAGGRIEVSAVTAGRHVQVSVRDTGAGIPAGEQDRIFDKFARLEGGGGTEGTGLGLAICREIVRAHGGTIWVESEPAKGSTFTFTVPIAKEGGSHEQGRRNPGGG